MMNTTPRCPAALSDAYDWTDSAGELDELCLLSGDALLTYCRESAENWRSGCSSDQYASGHPRASREHEITESDLLALHDWLAAKLAARIAAHAASEGEDDYHDRASDVASGTRPDDWAWPLASADEAYLSAVGVSTICEQIEIPASAWDLVCDAWVAAFRRGYEAAHASAGGP